MLSTAFALICACVAAFLCLLAVRAAERAESAAESLDRELRRVRALGLEVESLQGQVKRIGGRIYAQARREPVKSPQGYEDPQGALEDLDDDIAAQLALQSAPPADPGARRG